MKIFLIGMPGSGKSTIGKKLGEMLSLTFIDLDAVITQAEQRSIAEIFQEQGEEEFRKIEAAQLSLVTNSNHSFILACGGGTPCFYTNMDIMKQQGKVLFLDVSIETLAARVKNSSDRPLLQLESDSELIVRLKQLREKRIHFYNQATFTLKEEEITIDSIVNLLLKK